VESPSAADKFAVRSSQKISNNRAVFMEDLNNDTASDLQHVASKHKMVETAVNGEMEKLWKKAVVA
jgi:hypothetical protein